MYIGLPNLGLQPKRASASGPPLPPEPPSANRQGWWRKGIGITLNAGNVQQWADQSGNNYHFSEATAAEQPPYAAGVISLSGITRLLANAVNIPTQPLTLYMRMRQVAWTDGQSIGGDGLELFASLKQVGASPNLDMVALSGTISQPTAPLATWCSVAIVFDGLSSVFQIDGTSVAGDLTDGGLNGLILGSSTATATFDVAEVIVYDAAHDLSTREAVIEWLDAL